MKLTIGNVELKNNVILAPMAGVTDLPFRVLCKEQGAGLLCMEMVSAKAIYYGSKNTEDLMKNPKLAEEIITKMVKAVKKPVTVKIRKGFDEAHLNAVEMAKIAEASGAAAVAVHGRTREQYYAGKADWDCIRAVKEAVKIPVIGNGDVTDALSAERLLKETGCDGVMVGRAAQGNPFIFREITEYLETGVIPPKPTPAELRATIERHARMQMEEKGEYTGVREMRKHLSWYTVGYPNSAKYRQMINSMETMEELLHSLDMVFPKEA